MDHMVSSSSVFSNKYPLFLPTSYFTVTDHITPYNSGFRLVIQHNTKGGHFLRRGNKLFQVGRDSMASSSDDPTNFSDKLNTTYEMVKHVAIDIGNEPEDLNTTMWSIYRVPYNLRSLNEDAYTPQLVSIGPLHCGLKQLLPMQKHKLRYLNLFKGRLVNGGKAMDLFKEYLKSHEQIIRTCYAENLCDNIDEEELVEIMLLDSVFIMELFLRIQRQKLQEEEDRKNPTFRMRTYLDDIILKRSWLNKNIRRDLILLENQIPIFILVQLYDSVVPDQDKGRPTFIELAHDYFCNSYCNCHFVEKIENSYLNHKSSPWLKKLKDFAPKNFTDLKRYCYGPGRLRSRRQKGPLLKTATKLQEAGVTFEKAINRPLLDIRFRKHPILGWFLCLACIPKFKMVEHRLEIPQLRIVHETECVFRNIMALEQCHYPDEPYFCNYVSFFDSLIRTKEDVNLLMEQEIIEHALGSDMEVQTLVHDLSRNIETNGTCYLDLIVHFHRYYNRMWWNRNMATLRLVYFRDLWRVSSTIIGVVVFMFTLLNIYQTIRDFNKVKK